MRCMVVSVTVFIYSPSIYFTVSSNVGILMRLSRRNNIQFLTPLQKHYRDKFLCIESWRNARSLGLFQVEKIQKLWLLTVLYNSAHTCLSKVKSHKYTTRGEMSKLKPNKLFTWHVNAAVRNRDPLGSLRGFHVPSKKGNHLFSPLSLNKIKLLKNSVGSWQKKPNLRLWHCD